MVRLLVMLVVLVILFATGATFLDERVVSFDGHLPVGDLRSRATRTRESPKLAIDLAVETLWSGSARANTTGTPPPSRRPGDNRPKHSWGVQGRLLPSSQWGVVFDEPVTLTGLLIDRGESATEWTVPMPFQLSSSFAVGEPLLPRTADFIYGPYIRYEFEPVEVDGLVLRPRYRQKQRWALRNVRFQVADAPAPGVRIPEGWLAESAPAFGVALLWGAFMVLGGKRPRRA